jgi:Kdo2-lipid IVA lauroyltransferase/acyltransferase
MSRSRLRDAVEYAAALGVIGSLAYTPRPLAEALARMYAGMLDRLIPRLRRTAQQNLRMVMPELDAGGQERVINGVFRSIARLLVAFSRFPRLSRDNIGQWIRYEGYEHFDAAKRAGAGVLFATAHLGNWELSAFAHALLSEPMHLVVRPLDNPLIDGLVARRRTLSGNRLIGKKDFARSILTALKQNEAVGILIDQNSSADSGVFVDFFGIPACAGTGFAKLAAHSGAAVIPGFALWSEKERRYVLRFYSPVPVTGDVETDTRALQGMLEQLIREHPDQWLWIHRRWKTRPAGAPPLYQ